MADIGSPWLIRYGRKPHASVRLFCFHCAGGSASAFRDWSTHLPRTIELVGVQLPGREGRVKEAFVTAMDELINRVADAMTPHLRTPYAVFGHSFGTLGGFEVIRELRRRGLRQPFLFIAAGRQAPQLKRKKKPIASLPEQEFVDELLKDYGSHLGGIFRSSELREAFVPQIRADFALTEAYRYRDAPPLDCPIVAFGGLAEDDLSADELDAWGAQTTGRFHSCRFPGDHFFIETSERQVIEAIREQIDRSLSADEMGKRQGQAEDSHEGISGGVG
jgi:medium-chain acyl-[acyl-carrier-protein] hydrolase